MDDDDDDDGYSNWFTKCIHHPIRNVVPKANTILITYSLLVTLIGPPNTYIIQIQKASMYLFSSGSCNWFLHHPIRNVVLMHVSKGVKGYLEPTHLKFSPLFTFSTKSLGQDSPSVHPFSTTIGPRFTAVK